jgi:hypothetical protein
MKRITLITTTCPRRKGKKKCGSDQGATLQTKSKKN